MKIPYEDLQMWSVTSINPMFREAYERAEKIVKSGDTPVIIWHCDNREHWVEVKRSGETTHVDETISSKGFKQKKKKVEKKKK